MFIEKDREKGSVTKCHQCHQVSPMCHHCWATANSRRGGGCRGFLQSVTTFLVNIKKGGECGECGGKSVGVLIMETIYIFIPTRLM